jgi:hypothetical protein
MPPKRKFNPIRSRGRYRAPPPSPPRPQLPSFLNRFVKLKENRAKIVKSLRSNQTINFYAWSQRKHVDQMSYLMNVHKISPEAAFYMYREQYNKSA